MCFSAGASFTAAAVLSGIGITSLKKTSTRSQIMFASIPMLFGIQQLSEGFLWLSLSQHGYQEWCETATYIFLFFAQFLWPIWIPGSMLIMEHNKIRKKLLWVSFLSGIITSVLLMYRMIFLNVEASIQHHHIDYNIESPQWIIIVSSVLYVLSIVASPFLSSAKGLKPIAFLLLISLLATKVFYEAYLVSVWCFFAAGLSILVLRALKLVQEDIHIAAEKLEHKMD